MRITKQPIKIFFHFIAGKAAADRNKDVYVTVSKLESEIMYESNPDALCNYFDGPINYAFTLITCLPPIRGQFVQIQYKESENSVINLYEIEVHGV